MFSDPNMAMDMMKKNLSMIIPQTLTFAWVNFFFSGFVAAKIPFPLTQRFRSMLQNGIDLSTVDVSYVSSRSWYFLNLFGLRGLFSLILGEENAMDDTQRMMQMGGFGFDPTKVTDIWVGSILCPACCQTLSKNTMMLISHESPVIFQKTITLSIEGLQMALGLDLVIGILQSGIFKTLSKGDDSLDVAPGQRNFLNTGPMFAMSLSAEKDGLDIIQHEWALPKFEQRAEAVLKKLVS
ncbi:hypothetical protein OIU78_020143 [Salix suchowensis]|nr:hypothetical protein OIU78_020143 [Salix suchowensis]